MYLFNFVMINFTLFREFSRWSMLHSSVSFHAGLCLNIAGVSTSICFSVGLFLAMTARQLLKKDKNKA